jgi:hypothetical protein
MRTSATMTMAPLGRWFLRDDGALWPVDGPAAVQWAAARAPGLARLTAGQCAGLRPIPRLIWPMSGPGPRRRGWDR